MNDPTSRSIGQGTLLEFDPEMAHTRRTLERVPDDRLDWRPHEKSWPMAGLATHLAGLPVWLGRTLESDDFDIHPPGGELPRNEAVTSAAEALERFDRNVAAARAALAAATDATLLGPWSLKAAGKVLFTIPRIAVIRSMVLSHMIHHRAQLGLYLRMNDIAVPAIYGPSADEGF